MRRAALGALALALTCAGFSGAAAASRRSPLATPASAGAGQGHRPVLLVSIDGLRPGDVLEAEARGLRLPNLRRFVTEGSYATGVTGNLPTLTYPSHTTLITGVAPARHGIVNNTTFDPNQMNYGGWYWYAADLGARTLWDAAHDAGLTTANVHWPVSVGARHLTWNLPQIWRSGHADDRKLLSALATPGLVAALEHDGREAYAQGIDESLDGDRNRTRFAVDLIRTRKPGFLTVYLASLDHEEHAAGPGSAAANRVLEALDGLVGHLAEAEFAAHPQAAVAVVSDHGFTATDTEVNLFRPFIEAGLITVSPDGKITGWEAMPWPSGGSYAVVLARPDDAALVSRVAGLLERLRSEPAARISRVLDRAGTAAAGGNPQASFYVDLLPGALTGPWRGPQEPASRPAAYKGMHGYFPSSPDMRSTFLIRGRGIAAGRNLGEIDMRAIAPTLARLMGATLAAAEQRAIELGEAMPALRR